ncbi:MAG: creatininase family protein [Pseudomonadota bacterium]
MADCETINLLEEPHARAGRLCATGAPVYVGINPVEYHGPHLSLRNDAMISKGLALDMHGRLAEKFPGWPLLWAGELGMGADPVPGPGSRPVPFVRVREAVLMTCRSLVNMGARRVVLMSFHGSPMHNMAVQAGIDFLAQKGVYGFAPMNLLARAILDLDPELVRKLIVPVKDAGDRRMLLKRAGIDLHAGFGETSLALHYAPETVSPDYKNLPPCPDVNPVFLLKSAAGIASACRAKTLGRELSYAASMVGWHLIKPFPGYTSCPHLANAESGAILADFIASAYAAAAASVLAGLEPSPPPIMAWTRHLTFAGRFVDWVS